MCSSVFCHDSTQIHLKSYLLTSDLIRNFCITSLSLLQTRTALFEQALATIAKSTVMPPTFSEAEKSYFYKQLVQLPCVCAGVGRYRNKIL
jgi:hypothetical protein